MNTEFDCDLTPDQWETLKALRSPAPAARSRSRYVLESLVALDLVSIDGGFPVITILIMPAGMLLDRRGARFGLPLLMLWWSAANALHAGARTVAQFSLFRFLLGAGECGNYSGGIKVISQWFGPKQRALLAFLVMEANRVVSSDRLIDALWEEEPPETAQKAVQVYVCANWPSCRSVGWSDRNTNSPTM